MPSHYSKHRPFGRRWSAAISIAMLLLLNACGGGGGGNCSGSVVYDSYGYADNFGDGIITGEVGEPFTAELAAHVQSGCTPEHRLASGSLPAGLSFDRATGRISGTPTASGNFSISVEPAVSSNSGVSASIVLSIGPFGRQAPALAATQLTAPSGFATRMFSTIAAARDGGATHVWLAGWDNTAGRLGLHHSSDGGQTWNADSAANLIGSAGNAIGQGQFPLAATGKRLFVLEAGAEKDMAPLPSTLYRFDGTAWAVRNAGLPFRAPRGATMVAKADGSLFVAWMGDAGIVTWLSADEGLTWTQPGSDGGIFPGYVGGPAEAALCVGAAGADWVATAVPGSVWAMSRLGSSSTAWTSEAGWAWGSFMAASSQCAFDGVRTWIVGARASTSPAVLAVANIEAGEEMFSFPRKVPTAPATAETVQFDALAAADGELFGLLANPYGHTSYEVWRLH